MKIGFFFETKPIDGGMHQYAITMLKILYNYELVNDYVVFHSGTAPKEIKENDRWKFVQLQSCNNQSPSSNFYKTIFRKIKSTLKPAFQSFYTIRKILHYVYNLPLRANIERHNLDFMIYPTPTSKSFLTGIPYITTIHDLQHRIQPWFPEVSENGIWYEREYRYRNIIKTAEMMFVDSEIGKEDVVNFYNADSDKLVVLPTLAQMNYLTDTHINSKDVLKKYNLNSNYIFYPAQFWKHKNHKVIVQALNLLNSKYKIRLTSVFTGSKQGEYDNVINFAKNLQVMGQVVCLGYVPDEDLRGLYESALALVMPTYFGPTNVPVYEAWSAGCPVISSDIRGIREQVNDAGLLVTPTSSAQLADAIYKLIKNKELRQNLVSRGYEKSDAYTEKGFANILLTAIESLENKMAIA